MNIDKSYVMCLTSVARVAQRACSIPTFSPSLLFHSVSAGPLILMISVNLNSRCVYNCSNCTVDRHRRKLAVLLKTVPISSVVCLASFPPDAVCQVIPPRDSSFNQANKK